ncbi:MAG: glucuronate isomerase [Pseudozobellia sp.]|nr:glucuronate isomerase [Pseudozobellia sp.]MBG49313.1 glucuronate isomerase [Pseudozobellia sp.]|tara:strand:- start:150 stop:1556 length:1407 start_codon:yes stop_codon:yes gene_type:complete
MATGHSLINDNFLLESKYAQQLYHDFAVDMPVIDYHNHLSPKALAENTIFDSITAAWIDGDHYKWRAMRTLGIEEKFITGGASAKEKFAKWAYTVPYTMRNPLYHWTHMELSRYFGINDLLNEKNADTIFDNASEKLNDSNYSCRELISKMNVEVLCTTEDPTDTLEYHQQLAKSSFGTKVSTAFRPDKAILIDSETYNDYLDNLEKATNLTISTYEDLCTALKQRISYFHDNGCRLCDHGLNHLFAEEFTASEINAIFKKRREGATVTKEENAKFQSALLLFLSESYHEFGWVQQFHLGALRNNNKRMLSILGPDTGWDSMGDYPQAQALSKFLDTLDSKDKLTKTILYNLNPSDNAMMATMIGNFNDGSVKGKVQWGSGWWFLDQKDGMIEQMNTLSNMGLISCFIGMLTDSRSFLSFPRHEYFRRILCNLFGEDIKRGELPNDMDWIGKIVQDICYNNAKEYFDL